MADRFEVSITNCCGDLKEGPTNLTKTIRESFTKRFSFDWELSHRERPMQRKQLGKVIMQVIKHLKTYRKCHLGRLCVRIRYSGETGLEIRLRKLGKVLWKYHYLILALL